MEIDLSGDLVAVWEIHLADGVHMIEFEHGTTTGKRIIRSAKLKANSKLHNNFNGYISFMKHFVP